ncbi:protein kinase domain-containing protein [Roseateles cellulosilyticus]|uniref:Protein kinase n=1 Tax=Pelomonas cellulosilytica TaxID=2906762 RepID=A0ABS8XZ59_9BURK|nr:protein kinase [Pelomonas sp. P8]MCE4557904.1 protein kinase [Pelomonas sp. P8]
MSATGLSRFSDQWPAISALLDEALALPVAEQGVWLDSLVGERAAHRQALSLLLRYRSGIETGSFLNELPALDAGAPAPAAEGLGPGSQVGAYRLISEIASGGMGTVWLAERSDGLIKRHVALKLPRNVWGNVFAERLDRERDILAALEHEHIARLYDAGIDAQGRPFLAMEYVEGESIDVYCRQHGPSLGERVALLQQVMAAVAHAHARLVVHRDLKPSNILVTPQGQVKLLDFGIAKLLEGDRTRDTELTQMQGRALTLDFASPEQIRGEPIGTASDVYSLAVVAYEVLAGARPYRLKRASAAELEEAIASVEPPRASQSAPDPRVARQLRGDLDSILNKALKKEAGKRYATMDAFAQDLQRWREGKPVEARPDGVGYRAVKFVARYRLQVAAAGVVVLALVGGAAVAIWQARQAQRAAVTAEAVQGFIESVFNANTSDQADPEAAQATTARQLLDRGAERVDQELASAPEAQLRLYKLMAEMYVGMAVTDRALEMEQRSLALATRLYGEHSETALRAAVEIGLDLESLGRWEEALAVLLKADAAASSRHRDEDEVRMLIDAALGTTYKNDPAKALEWSRRAAAIARAHQLRATGIDAMYSLGEAARKTGNLKEASEALQEAVRWIELEGKTGEMAIVLSQLAAVQNDLGQLDAAVTTLKRAIEFADRKNDIAGHAARFKLARFYYENRLLREALEAAEPELAWARTTADSGGDLPSAVMGNYGRALLAYGDAKRGLKAIEESQVLMPHATEGRIGLLLAAQADALVALGQPQQARSYVERAVASTANAGDRTVEMVRVVQRRYWVASGQAEQALQDFRVHPPKPGETDTASLRLRRQAEEAELLLACGRASEAGTVAAEGLAALERLPERRFERDAQARLTAVRGQALLQQGRVADAQPVLEQALALHVRQYDPERSAATARVRQALADAQRQAAELTTHRQ